MARQWSKPLRKKPSKSKLRKTAKKLLRLDQRERTLKS